MGRRLDQGGTGAGVAPLPLYGQRTRSARFPAPGDGTGEGATGGGRQMAAAPRAGRPQPRFRRDADRQRVRRSRPAAGEIYPRALTGMATTAAPSTRQAGFRPSFHLVLVLILCG